MPRAETIGAPAFTDAEPSASIRRSFPNTVVRLDSETRWPVTVSWVRLGIGPPRGKTVPMLVPSEASNTSRYHGRCAGWALFPFLPFFGQRVWPARLRLIVPSSVAEGDSPAWSRVRDR